MARKPILILIFTSFTLFVHGQNRLDSLQSALIEAKPDTHKVQLLIQIGAEVLGDDLEAAASYFDESLELAESIEDEQGLYNLGMSYNLLGASFADQGDFSRGKLYYHKSLKIFEGLGNPYGVATLSSNLGDIYLEEDSNKLAERYYVQALPVFESAGDKESFLQVQVKRGINLSEQRKYRTLGRLLEPLENEIVDLGDLNMRQTLYALLSDANAERKKFYSAYNYSVKAAMVSDSVWASELEGLEQYLQNECLEKIKEAEASSLEKETPLAAASEMEDRMLIGLVLGGVFFFLMLIILVMQAIKIKAQKQTIADLEA